MFIGYEIDVHSFWINLLADEYCWSRLFRYIQQSLDNFEVFYLFGIGYVKADDHLFSSCSFLFPSRIKALI